MAVSFLRASLENCGWWVGRGSEWDPRLSGAAVEAATENKCFRLVKTPDFGTVVSMILNYMQRARGSSIYPYHLQFLLSVTLSMYLWVEYKAESLGGKFQVFPDINTLRQRFSQHPQWAEGDANLAMFSRVPTPGETHPFSHPLHVAQSL